MWDKMVQNDVMCRDALYVEGVGRLPCQWEFFFAKISSEKGILGQF